MKTGDEGEHSNGNCSIFEIAANLLEKPDFLATIPENSTKTVMMVKNLLLCLGSGSSSELEKCLTEFGVNKESHLFSEVGKITRSLHTSLGDFAANLSRDNLTMSSTNIPDATEKLNAVIAMTFDAANKTIDNMEAQSQLIVQLRTELTAYKLRFPLVQQNDSFLLILEDRLQQLEELASRTVVGQNFQDLTGQSIKKVIKLVSDLEQNLISIIKVFGFKEINRLDNDEVSHSRKGVNQDEVDCLLKDLGF